MIPAISRLKVENGKMENTFSTRELADYTVLTDSIAPLIKEHTKKYSYIIEDELSGIKSFEAKLNGEWVLMKYEPKDNMIWIDWLNDEMKKTGEFVLKVTDHAGNEKEYITKL